MMIPLIEVKNLLLEGVINSNDFMDLKDFKRPSRSCLDLLPALETHERKRINHADLHDYYTIIMRAIISIGTKHVAVKVSTEENFKNFGNFYLKKSGF